MKPAAMKRLYILSLLFAPLFTLAQYTFTGAVSDETGKPLPFATVALLHPADSTLAFFGITNENGRYEIRQVKSGSYLMQVSFIGYTTYYHNLSIRTQPADFGIIVLKQRAIDLPATSIESERIPLSIRQDTVEYNAGAFKTRPDAVAEDLLKKLPGIEVDRAGNIKALGEDVKNVMVDGKEFFSSDPKVATKNLPADAINKVQVYDKKSEDAELAGIEDDSHEKTINLLLKDGRKQAWLGELSAGGGTGDHYDLAAKAYRFTAKNQFAVLGMVNNINKFGFTFRDYLDFNGGLQAMHGGGMKLTLNSDDDIPVDFGQTIEGLVTSGAGGLNYSYEHRKNSRLYMSYLTNGSGKTLQKDISTTNYTPSGEYSTESNEDRDTRNFAHKLTVGMKDRSDSTRTILFDGNARLSTANENIDDYAFARASGDVVNTLKTNAEGGRDELSAGGSLTGLYRGNEVFRLFNVAVNGSWKSTKSSDDRFTLSSIPGMPSPLANRSIRNSGSESVTGGLSAGTLIKIASRWYLNPRIKLNYATDHFNRELKQGMPNEGLIDSLSPSISRINTQLIPVASLRYSSKKTKISAGTEIMFAYTGNSMPDSLSITRNYSKILPFLTWEYNYRTGRRLSLNYSVSAMEPNITSLVPVADNTDPQYLIFGNRQLKPETRHDLFANWMLFDQFSQTSLFTSIGGSYTLDKIGYARTIRNDLVQIDRLINSGEESSARADIEFTTPLRFAGVNLHMEVSGSYSQGEGIVNNITSSTDNFRQNYSLSFTNRKTDHWNIEAGGEITFNTSKRELPQTITNRYTRYNYFGTIEYTPVDKWHFTANAEIDRYTSESFGDAVTVPMLSASASYNFLKNNKGMLKLSGFDLLDKNKGINRISEFNFLTESRSNIIRRYIMLTFTYRLNPGSSNDRIDVRMK